MFTVAAYESAMAPFTPDYMTEVMRTNREEQIEAPILSLLLAQGRTLQVKNESFKWNTADLPTRTTTVNNGGTPYTSGDTSIVVAAGSTFRVGDLVLCEATREVIYITAISTHTLTVVRGIGSANGAPAAHASSVANGAVLRRIGPAMGEASGAPADADFGSVTHEQNIQTFKTAVSVSGRANVLDPQVESPLAFNRAQAYQVFVRDIEHAILFGGRQASGVSDAAGKKVTTMHGLYNAITTNVFSVGGTMTRAYFEGTVCAQVFARGSGTKTLIGGPTLMQTIADLYASRATRPEQVEVAGIRLTRVQNMHGELLLMPSRALSGSFGGDGLILDMDDEFRLRYTDGELNGMPRRGLPNLMEVTQTGGADAQTEQWFAELGLQWGAQSKHARISGVTGAA